MATKRRATQKEGSVPLGLGLGLLANLAVVCTGAAGGAWLILWDKLPQDKLGLCALVTVFLASASGAFVTAQFVGKQRLIMCILSGGCGYVILVGITALAFGGQYAGLGVTALMAVLGSMLVATMGVLPEKGSKKTGAKKGISLSCTKFYGG